MALSLDDKSTRFLRFLKGLAVPRVFHKLTPYGFTLDLAKAVLPIS